MSVAKLIADGHADRQQCPHQGDQPIWVTNRDPISKLVSCAQLGNYLQSGRCAIGDCIFLHPNASGCPYERRDAVVFQKFGT